MSKQDPLDGGAPAPPGSPPDLQQLFERYLPAVVYFFQRKGFTREESRDLAQETFFRVHKGMSRFRGEARVETWLFKIAGNLALNARRYEGAGRRQHEEVSLDVLLETGQPVFGREPAGGDPVADPLADLLQKERVERLRQALDDLPAKMRRVLRLRLEQDLKYREIAALEGISIETVKAHLFQAKALLAARLADGLTLAEQAQFEEAG